MLNQKNNAAANTYHSTAAAPNITYWQCPKSNKAKLQKVIVETKKDDDWLFVIAYSQNGISKMRRFILSGKLTYREALVSIDKSIQQGNDILQLRRN